MTTHDEKLDSLLKSLPRERAADDFTGRVLDRIDRSKPPVFLYRRLALVTAAALVTLAVALPSISYFRQKSEKEELRQELRSLKADYREIARQYEMIRTPPEAAAMRNAVIYVGGDDSVDYVIDISKLKERLSRQDELKGHRDSPGLTDLRPAFNNLPAIPANYQGGSI